MIEEPPLLTIRRPTRRPSQEQIAAFQNVASSFVVDAMYGHGAFPATIRALGDGRDYDCRAAGPALTVEAGPGDILALLAALPEIQPGDVVISSFGGYQGCAAAGDRVSAMMKNCGAAGFVTDGPMRDYEGIVAAGLPAWCTGLTPGSPFSKGPGRVGFPVQLAGVHVEPGDIVVADRDGVVVVPFDRIDETIAMLPRVAEMEAALDEALKGGLTVPDEVREMLTGETVKYV